MKTLGLVLIFLGFSATGVIKSRDYSKRKEEVYAFVQMLRFIKREITFNRTRQMDIFEKFENKTLEKNGFLKELRERNITDDKSPLFHLLNEKESHLMINRECRGVLLEFAESFGQLPVYEQVEKCNSCLNILEEIYKKEKEEVTSRAKAARSMGVMAGIAAVLLLM